VKWEKERVWRRKKWLPATVFTGVKTQDRSGLVKGVESGIDQAD
jgi:hypothetical protein